MLSFILQSVESVHHLEYVDRTSNGTITPTVAKRHLVYGSTAATTSGIEMSSYVERDADKLAIFPVQQRHLASWILVSMERA